MDVGRASVSALPPVASVRERDLDLLLAELLVSEPSFTTWLVGHCPDGVDRPIVDPSQVHAVVSFARPEAPLEAAGETDVLVLAEYQDTADTLLLSIENKAWAPAQPNQAGRHCGFVASARQRWGFAVLVAPSAWASSHDEEAQGYHVKVDLEAVAEWCRARGFSFQARVFDQACVRPERDVALDLLDWHNDLERFLSDTFGVRLAPGNYVRTRNAASAKKNRWPSCADDTLLPIRGVDQPSIVLQPNSAKEPARVAIWVSSRDPELVGAIVAAADERGFKTKYTGKTLMIRRLTRSWEVGPVDRMHEELTSVGAAIIELRDWWNDWASAGAGDGQPI